MGTVYLDSSVALRTILDVPERAALQTWMSSTELTCVSSRLLHTEVTSVLRRDSRPVRDGAALLGCVGHVDITREVRTVAESIERHIKTLDALHLTTALLIGESVAVASHDMTMKVVAENLGLDVVDPVLQARRAVG
ncbi:PIN domain-containing protein [Gordonia sp. DT30]|uniref:PIN domain-containing protein n=1 Tax=Gordonia sp. DT30 TaxID=3416546 RepID=UPI003CE9A164